MYQQNLNDRDNNKAAESIDTIKENLEPLNFWMLYKDLAQLLASRCDDISLMSDDELTYLTELSDKLWDKDSDVGLGRIPQFYSRLEDLKAGRELDRVTTLKRQPMDANTLDSILIPEDFEKKINEYRKRGHGNEERKGLWNAWENLAKLSEVSMDNIIASGIDSGKVQVYIDTFMTQNLYSNVFQAGMDRGIKEHIVDMFKLYFRLKKEEGMGVEDMPGFITKELDTLLDLKGNYQGWRGTKEFAFMHLSASLAEDGFLEAEWKRYEPNAQCLEWAIDFIKKGEVEKAHYVKGMGDDCGWLKSYTSPIITKAIFDFTKLYVRQGELDEEKGELIAIAQKYLSGDYRLELCQPFTYQILETAAETVHVFAKDILEMLEDRGGMNDFMMMGLFAGAHAKMNQKPFLDEDSQEVAMESLKKVIDIAKKYNEDNLSGAPSTFLNALREGRYIRQMNECNTSLEDMKSLARFGKTEIRLQRERHECDHYIYVAPSVSFHFEKKKPTIYVGNPQHYNMNFYNTSKMRFLFFQLKNLIIFILSV